MSNNLQSSGHTILTRLMLLFIVATFALWGIGDIFRGGGSAMVVATVGTQKISAQEYATAVKNRQEEVRKKLGKMYTPDLMKKFNIEPQVLEAIINRTLLQQEAVAQGLVVGEDSIAEYIATAPEFRDSNGKFSKEQYQAILQSNRMTEKDFIAVMAQQLSSKLLLSTISAGITPPEDLVYALYRARAEKRKSSLLTIPLSAVAKNFVPTEDDVKAYYEGNSRKYIVPESRAFSYVEIGPDDVKGLTVSDDDIKKLYEQRMDTLHQPERRVIEQLVYEKKEDAEKANALIVSGKSMKEVAASTTPLNKDKLLLGELTKERMPVAADEAFTLKEGQSTRPYESAFGWHIVHVVKILPAGIKPLEQVQAALAEEIKLHNAQDGLFKLSNSFEDMLGGGATFEQAAEKMELKVHTVPAITKAGTKAAGGKADLPAIGNLLDVAFSTNEKDHSRMMQSDNGTYFMVQVSSIEKEHARPLEEVKAEVKESLINEQHEKQVKALADQLAEGLKAGKKLEEALAGKKLSVAFEPSGLLQRNSDTVEEGKLKGRVLPPELVKDIFSVKKDSYTAAHVLPEGGYMIGKVEQVIAAPDIVEDPNSGISPLQTIRSELGEMLPNEVQYYYLQYLRKKYPVSIHQETLKAVTDRNG